MADAGVPVHVLGKIAALGSLNTTQRYLHPDRRSIDAAGEKLSAHLSPATDAPGPHPVPKEDRKRHLRKPVRERRKGPLTWGVLRIDGPFGYRRDDRI